MNSNFDYPYRRFAIRAITKNGMEYWLTDDGMGCDDSNDFTDYDDKQLLVYIERAAAQSHVDGMKEYASERKLKLRVMRVWEYPDGTYYRWKKK